MSPKEEVFIFTFLSEIFSKFLIYTPNIKEYLKKFLVRANSRYRQLDQTGKQKDERFLLLRELK